MKLIADNHTLSICDATTGHAVRPIAFFDTAAHCRQVIARQERMEETLRRVRSSIDVSLIRTSNKARIHWEVLADIIDDILKDQS